MKRFVVKHVAFLLLTLSAVSFLVFTLNEFSPGAVARKILGAYATQEQVDLLTKQMGLDRPVLVRYVEYVKTLASGDLGYSTRFKLPEGPVTPRLECCRTYRLPMLSNARSMAWVNPVKKTSGACPSTSR